MAVERFGGRGKILTHPAQYVVVTFVVVIAVGTVLLRLPMSTIEGADTGWLTALFTATSASCVTGLTVVDTASHWSGFGQGVILALIQVGGLGIMTLSSLIILVLARKLGLRQRVIATSATGAAAPGDLKNLLWGVVRLTVAAELITAVLLFVRFWGAHDIPFGRAVYDSVFHAVSAFNNAGFSLFAGSMEQFRDDPILLVTITLSVIVGGLGFPVWLQIARHRRQWRKWDLHAKLTVSTSLVLIAVAWVGFMWFEWGNPNTIGDLPALDSIANGLFQSVSFRTAGFATMPIGGIDAPTQLMTEILMFIGGGSASTAGGIKVTTFALLAFVMWAEVRGDPDVVIFERRVPYAAQRQALTVALMAVGVVIVSTMVLLTTSELPRPDLLFESISALGTTGLSTGITPELTESGKLWVIALMFVGRIGPPTLFAALVLRERDRLYRYPEERPIVG